MLVNVNIGQPIDGTPVAANNDVGNFHFLLLVYTRKEAEVEVMKLLHPHRNVSVIRGGATVGRVRTRGGVRQNRGGIRQNRGGVNRSECGGRIGNPLSQWERIEKDENINFKDLQYHEIEGCNYRMK